MPGTLNSSVFWEHSKTTSLFRTKISVSSASEMQSLFPVLLSSPDIALHAGEFLFLSD